jgi:hypothetical protein
MLLVENCTVIHISKLQTLLKKQVKRDFLIDATSPDFFEKIYGELKKFKVNDQTFDFESDPNVYGGFRWFFLCPQCHKRALKLFLPPRESGKEQLYLCKKCHNIKNRSVAQGTTKIYREFYRPLKRLRFIEKRLERGKPAKEDVKALLAEYEQLEKDLKNNSNYLLYAFREKHPKNESKKP